MKKLEYAGFWIRLGASAIDSILALIVFVPMLMMLGNIYGVNQLTINSSDAGVQYWASFSGVSGIGYYLINYILPALVVLLFWIYKSATPGKIITRLKILDAKTGKKPTLTQFIIRYLGYYVSALVFFLGFLWIVIDKRKQGWHDKIAGTVVVRDASREEVEFDIEDTEN
jgi:uncharacterized RDD family membrane protein YckC